jgi:hypothetical protein
LTTSNKTKRRKQKTWIRENSASSRNPPYVQTLTIQTLIFQTPWSHIWAVRLSHKWKIWTTGWSTTCLMPEP